MSWLYISHVRHMYDGHFMIHPKATGSSLVILFLFGNKSSKVPESGCVNHC